MKNHIILAVLMTVLVSFTLFSGCTSQEAAPSTPTPTTATCTTVQTTVQTIPPPTTEPLFTPTKTCPVQQLPQVFYGSVTIDGNPAPINTIILATGPGVRTSLEGNPVITQTVGSYNSFPRLLVQGCIEEGSPLTFFVNGQKAEVYDVSAGGLWRSTYPFSTGGYTNLNIRTGLYVQDTLPPNVEVTQGIVDGRPATIYSLHPAPKITSSGITITLNSISEWSTDNQFSQPDSGYEYLIADFTITNNGYTSDYYFNPNYAKIKDPDNYMYQYASVSYSVPGYFDSTTIPQGETRRGKLVFMVPNRPAGTYYELYVSS